MKKKALLLTLGFLIASSSNALANPLTNRLYGDNRYDTSAKISSSGWEKSDYVILANGENFADALSAVPLAKKYNAPLILAGSTSTSDCLYAKTELNRLNPKEVIIIGGPSAVSKLYDEDLLSKGIAVKRIYGNDRYDTSIEIAKEIGTKNGIAITNGESFADALSISSISANKQMPILLTAKSKLPESTKDFLDKSSYNQSYVIGGTNAIDENVCSNLKNFKRLFGNNRYDTNIAVLNEFKSDIDVNNLYVASGENFPDALSLSSLATKNNSALVLSSKDISKTSMDYISSIHNNIKNITVCGSPSLISSYTLSSIKNGAFSDSSIDDFSDLEFIDKANMVTYLNFTKFKYNEKTLQIDGDNNYLNYKLFSPIDTKDKFINETENFLSKEFLSTLTFTKIENDTYLKFYSDLRKFDGDVIKIVDKKIIDNNTALVSVFGYNENNTYFKKDILFKSENNLLKIAEVNDSLITYEKEYPFIQYFDSIKNKSYDEAVDMLQDLQSYTKNDNHSKFFENKIGEDCYLYLSQEMLSNPPKEGEVFSDYINKVKENTMLFLKNHK